MKKKFLFVLNFALFFSIGFGTLTYAEYFGGKWHQRVVYYGVSYNVSSTYTTPIDNGLKAWNGLSNYISYKNFKDIGISQPVDVWVRSYTNELGLTAAEWAARGFYGFGVPSPDDTTGPYDWGNIYLIRANTDPLSSTNKKRVIMHEAGHVLGLAHTTKAFTSSVMDEGDIWGLDSPTTYDKNNIIGLY